MNARERLCDGCGRKTGLLVVKRRAELCPECYSALCAATEIEIVLVVGPSPRQKSAGFPVPSPKEQRNVC